MPGYTVHKLDAHRPLRLWMCLRARRWRFICSSSSATLPAASLSTSRLFWDAIAFWACAKEETLLSGLAFNFGVQMGDQI